MSCMSKGKDVCTYDASRIMSFYSQKDIDQQDFRFLSCRIQITLQGFEWFLYNRTAAYDSIISQMEDSFNRDFPHSADRNGQSQRLDRWGKLTHIIKLQHSSSTRCLDSAPSRGPLSKRTSRVPATIQQAFTWFKEQLPVLDPKELLPLGIQVSKGAIICGNSSTPNLVVAEFNVCQGTFGVTKVVQNYSPQKNH